jgi:hypothetical protein
MTSTDDWGDWAKGQECPFGKNADGTCYHDPAQDWDATGSLDVADTYQGARERSMLDLMSQGVGALGTMGGAGSEGYPAMPAPPAPSVSILPPPQGADRGELIPWTWGRGFIERIR